MAFELTTAEFTGPIEVLLDLIERRKLPINDISLTLVTDEYLSFISGMGNETETMANKIHFVYVASTLALIKSKSLLPNLELTRDEETDIEQLKQRLLLYQQYQKIAVELSGSIHTRPQFFYARERRDEVRFSPSDNMQRQNFELAIESVFHELPLPPQTKQEGYIKIAIHIEEVMKSIVERVVLAVQFSFQNFLQEGRQQHNLPKEQKVFAVVSFLALLEVVRNHGVVVQQEALFADIAISQ